MVDLRSKFPGSKATPRSDLGLFTNQFPDEATPPHSNPVRPSYFFKVRGAQWFDYVVLKDGSLVLGERTVGQGHANLALGQPARAAGQVSVSGGRIIEVDNASGHYLPTGPSAGDNAIQAFRTSGFSISDSAFVEKTWNARLMLWEPI